MQQRVWTITMSLWSPLCFLKFKKVDEFINGWLFTEEIQILKKCKKHQITFSFKCRIKKIHFITKKCYPFGQFRKKNFFCIQRQEVFFYFNGSVYGAWDMPEKCAQHFMQVCSEKENLIIAFRPIMIMKTCIIVLFR